MREASGITVEEVAARTRVPARSVRALEANRWDELPAAVYTRGFIRAIARLCHASDGEIDLLLTAHLRSAPARDGSNVPSIKKSDLLVPILVGSDNDDRARAAVGLAFIVLAGIAIPIVAFLLS